MRSKDGTKSRAIEVFSQELVDSIQKWENEYPKISDEDIKDRVNLLISNFILDLEVEFK